MRYEAWDDCPYGNPHDYGRDCQRCADLAAYYAARNAHYAALARLAATRT